MTSNLHLKLFALVLAFTVWFYVQSGDKLTDKLITVPLTVEGLPEGIAVVTALPDQVELYIRGPQSRVQTAEDVNDEGELTAELNLKRAAVGKKTYTIRITGTNLRWMYHDIHPGPKLEIECEESSQKTFKPQRFIIGELEPGTFIESESGLPETVTVTGAKSLIARVTKVVYKLSETDLIGSDTINVNFIPQDSNGRQVINLEVSPPAAELFINVRKASTSLEVPVVYNLKGNPPSGYTVTDIKIEPLYIKVEGSSELLKNVTRIETVPIDLTDHTRDFTIPDFELVLPNERLKLEQSTVRLEVRIAQKTTTRLFEGLTVTWGDANDQFLHYSSEPRTVDITVTGPLDAVEKLEREMIVPSVNVGGLTEGWHEDQPVGVRILLPKISLVKIEPDTLRIHVQKRKEYLLEEERENE